MMTDPKLTSWVASANGHQDFPIQNLPLGIFSTDESDARGGIAIGDQVLDIRAALEAGLFQGDAQIAAEAASTSTLNSYFALPAELRSALRVALTELLKTGSPYQTQIEQALPAILYPQSACTLHLPAAIGDYTDFYVGIHHALNVGKLFRPDNPLLPNYKYVPIGYHGRASTVSVSGTEVMRPQGQQAPGASGTPQFGPSKRLDLELEIGVWIGSGNSVGQPIDISEASDQIAGLCLLNDWSARDIQAWEYQPLGPFLSKSFLSTVSPWVVTSEALQPFRKPQPARPQGDPEPLPYLFDQQDQASGAFDIELEVWLSTAKMRSDQIPAVRIARSNTLNMYWTVAQMIAHHTVNGCSLRPGDLLGSGTLSGPEPGSYGSLLEITEGGRQAVELPNGESRTFLEDGDEISLVARCHREGYPSIGFGECRGIIGQSR